LGKLTTAQKEDLKRNWREGLSGQSNSIMILEGNIEYFPVSVNPDD
jgi:hypothetical protein